MVLGLIVGQLVRDRRTDPYEWTFLTCEEDFYTLTIES